MDYGDIIAKLTSEMDSLPSTTHLKWCYTTLAIASLDHKLHIDQITLASGHLGF